MLRNENTCNSSDHLILKTETQNLIPLTQTFKQDSNISTTPDYQSRAQTHHTSQHQPRTQFSSDLHETQTNTLLFLKTPNNLPNAPNIIKHITPQNTTKQEHPILLEHNNPTDTLNTSAQTQITILKSI